MGSRPCRIELDGPLTEELAVALFFVLRRQEDERAASNGA
jgi:hypothetical protein